MTASKAWQDWFVGENDRWQPRQNAGQKCSLLQNSLKRGLSPGQLQVRLPLIARLKIEGAFLGSQLFNSQGAASTAEQPQRAVKHRQQLVASAKASRVGE